MNTSIETPTVTRAEPGTWAEGGRLATVNASREQLAAAIGAPSWQGNSDDGKVTIQWAFRTPHGVAEVRDYWWNAPGEWSIGADNPASARALIAHLRSLGLDAVDKV